MKHVLSYMAVIAMLLISCNNGGSEKSGVDRDTALAAEMPGDQNKSRYEDGLSDQHQPPPQVKTTKFTPPQIVQDNWDKKIIKTAEVTLELKDYASYNQKLHAGLKEEQAASPERIGNEITIKVPVDQFENLMNSFSGEGVTLLQKKINSEDVSEEVVDTRSRMEARKQVRDRYLDLLKQARNMKEILEVQKEINAIQEDIESAAGRVGYLNHHAAYSTIHLQYFQYLNGVPPPQPSGFIVQLKEGFNSGIRALGNLLVLLVSIWPLLLGALLVWALIRRRRQPGNKPVL
jgi:hypothetical protein